MKLDWTSLEKCGERYFGLAHLEACHTWTSKARGLCGRDDVGEVPAEKKLGWLGWDERGEKQRARKPDEWNRWKWKRRHRQRRTIWQVTRLSLDSGEGGDKLALRGCEWIADLWNEIRGNHGEQEMQGALFSCGVAWMESGLSQFHSQKVWTGERRRKWKDQLRETEAAEKPVETANCRNSSDTAFWLVHESINQFFPKMHAQPRAVPGNCSPKQSLCSCIHRFHILIVPLCWLHQQQGQARARQPSFSLPLAHQLTTALIRQGIRHDIIRFLCPESEKRNSAKGIPFCWLRVRCGSPQSHAEWSSGNQQISRTIVYV